VTSIGEKLGETTERLTDYLEHGGPGIKSALSGVRALAAGKSPFRAALSAGATGLKEQVKQLFGRGGGGKKKLKLTNIVEELDVGVPLRLAYDQWTQLEEFPGFMKKVESVERESGESEEKVNWKAQVWWSHRTWESTIIEQVPDDHIVWRSTGAKGYVDGVVTFAELAPNLTRILLVLEYHPQGFFEHTGNLWRAQGRRARLEFKHFRRHVMSHTLLQPDEIEGWRGEIRDGQVVKTHEEAVEEEELHRKRQEAEAEEEAVAAEREPEEDREPPAEEPEAEAPEERAAPRAHEVPEARAAREEEHAAEDVRRRRSPARRSAAPRSDDEYEDEAEAEPAPASTRGRPPSRRRSGSR
jgi:uncharacterized membrane protein